MDIIWLLVKASRTNVVLAILAGLVSGGCSASLIALINQAISQENPQSLVISFVGLAAVALISGVFSQFLLIDLAQDAVYRLRLQFSDRILAAPLQQTEALGPSKLLAVLTKDVDAISNAVFAIPTLCTQAAVLAGCLAYMGWLSGMLFILVAIFLALAIALIQVSISAAYHYLASARIEANNLLECFRGVTSGTKELKLHSARRQLFLDEDLETTAAAFRGYTKMAYKLSSVSSTGGQTLFFVLIGLLLFAAPQFITFNQAVLPAYVLTIAYILGPIEGIVVQLPNLLQADVSIKKINEMGLSLAKSAELSSVVRQNTQDEWKTLALKGVVHTYQSEDSAHPFAVGPISITIQAGDVVFIVGGNGSGKSTLAKLITGLYVPDSGELQLDDRPINDHNREWYRQHFSAIFSDFYLFSRLVSAEALTLDSQAQTYLEKLQLEQKVSVEAGQLSTTALSQGQRKRLALLSAYLEDRSIYLFDEWAADQDPVFREIFYKQLLAELKARGKTVLVISHDDQYFHLADRIIKLDYGQLQSDDQVLRSPRTTF